MKKLSRFSILLFMCIWSMNVSAQDKRFRYLNYIFPADSIRGFDEVQANQDALHGGFFGLEYKVFMYRAKRSFIERKYGYGPAPTMDSYMASNAKGASPSINTAPCNNEDFEASPVGNAFTISGWTISEGQNNGTNGSCTLAGCCPTSPSTSSDFWIVATPLTDPVIGTIPNSPFGGTKVLKMNDNITNMGEIVRIQQTFPVTSSNALFKFAYMAAMDGTGHLCCDQPFMKITLLNCSNTPLACPSVSITPPGASCASSAPAGWTQNASGISLTTSWQVHAIDLTPYLGSCVTIQVTVGDCDGWAHYGYAYFDASCAPMNVVVNNVNFPVGSSATNVSACAATATMVAPPGLGPYSWTGPGGSGITANPNQTITTTVGGNYTLTMNPLGACAPITRTVSLTFTPPPSAGFTTANSCTNYTITNTGTGSPAVQTYSFAGAGAPSSYTTTNSTSSVIFPSSGTYTIYQTITSGSCTATTSQVVNVPNGPNVAFSTPNYTQCITGNSFVFTAASGGGTQSYSFSPAAGAPAPGNTSTYGPVSFTSPGTYTVTHNVTQAGCTGSTNSVVVITPIPTPTASNNGPLCQGSNLVLSGLGGGTYSWSGPGGFSSAVQNPTITSAPLSAAGQYTLMVNVGGCTNSTVTNVTITTPTASAGNSGPYCEGVTAQFTTNAATSYTWSGPGGYTSNAQNATIPNVTSAAAGVYTVNITLGSCIATATTALVINPSPTATAVNNGPICEGQSLSLTGGGGGTYQWSGPNGFSSTNQNTVIAVASPTDSGTYTIIVTGANSCVDTTTTSVTINPLPVPTAGNNGPVCTGGSLVLNAGGGGTYQWSGPNSFSSLAQSPTIAPSATVNSGVYTVTVTLSGCTGVATTTVTVTTPTASAGNTGPYCAGSTIQLNAITPGTSYAWTGPGGYVGSGQNPTIPNSTTAMSGVYSLTVSFSGGCTASSTTSVTVNPLPNPSANSNSPVCIGQNINFVGGGVGTFSWTGPGGYNNTAQSPTITSSGLGNTGTYTLMLTDVNGCVNYTTTNVVVNPQPIVNATGTTVCENSSATLFSNGGVTYQWSGPNGFTSSSQNPVINPVLLNNAGPYTVLVTDANTCTNTAMTNLGVIPAVTPTISCNSPVCQNDLLAFSAGGGVSYSWSGPNGFTASNNNPSFTASSLSMNGTYVVTVTDANGCFASTSITATVNPLPLVSIVSGPNKGCPPLCVNYTVQSLPAAANTNWTFGNGTFTNGNNNGYACYMTTGIYTINAAVSDINGCPGAATYTAEVYPQPVADFNHSPIKPIVNIDPEVTFTDASHGAPIVGWNWYFMNTAQYQSTFQNPTFIYQDPGDYVVALVVKSDKGCMDTLIKKITVGEDFGIYVPNTFTPNSDGLNDIFQPKGFGIIKYNLQIFDRWGEKIFESNEFEKGWDGIYQGRGGKICQEDIYVWKIKVTSVFNKAYEYTGHVTLIK